MLKSNDPFPAVSLFDEAIDLAQTDIQTYRDTRDLSLVRFLPGATPVTYYLRRIPRHLVIGYIQAAPEHERPMRAFMVGVERVEGLPADDGRTVRTTWSPSRKEQLITGPMSFMDAVELEMFEPAVIEELGSLAFQRSFLARKNAATWPLPRLLLDVWEETVYRRAELIRNAPPPSSAGVKDTLAPTDNG